MAKYVNWHGTIQDSRELQRALNRHCACRVASNSKLDRCGPHQLLLEGDMALNRLLFARWIAHRLRREEHLKNAGAAGARFE
jgi:hypothetical protein